MSRLKIDDLPVMENLDETQMKGLFGGFFFLAAAAAGAVVAGGTYVAVKNKGDVKKSLKEVGGFLGKALPHAGLAVGLATNPAGALQGLIAKWASGR